MCEKMNQNFNKNHQIQHHNDEKDENFDQISHLPHDLITYLIIIRLPIKSLLKLKLLSKHWHFTLSSTHFGLAHFNFSKSCIRRSDVSNEFTPFNPTSSLSCTNHLFVQCDNDYFIYTYDTCVTTNHEPNKGLFKLNIDGLGKLPFVVVGSCNGLVCLYCCSRGLVVCNPVISNWVKISCDFFERGNRKSISTYGFGYVSSLGDYKIVRMSESTRNSSGIIVDVYSMRSREWKQVYDGKIDGYVLRGGSLSGGVLVNETLYWIMYRKGGDYEQDILGFDLVRERFVEVVGLVPGDSYLGGVRFVCCMGGCLGMGRFTTSGDVSVSILKESGQVEYIGLYRDLGLGSCCSAVGFTGDGKFFVQVGQRELGLVDPSCSPKRYTRLFKFEGEGFIDIKGYVPSLVSPSAVADM